jgi:hypothetical protein
MLSGVPVEEDISESLDVSARLWANIHKGVLEGLTVFIKKMQVSQNDDPEKVKVRYPSFFLFRIPLSKVPCRLSTMMLLC